VYPFVSGGTDTSFTRSQTPNGQTFLSILQAAGTTLNKSVILNQCGVYYMMGNPARPQFIPLAAHDTLDIRYKWLIDSLLKPVLGRPGSRANAINYLKTFMPAVVGQNAAGANQTALLKNGSAYTTASARCFSAGDPNLMPVERPGGLYLPLTGTPDTLPIASRHGGEDTTFTSRTKTGVWKPWTGWAGASSFTGATRRQLVEEPYLWPVHRTQNLNSTGVVYIGGNIYLSGLFRGRVTLYVNGDVNFTDDLTYVTNPASLPICQNLLGIITGQNIWIADNNINRPRYMDGTGTANARFLDDNQDFFLHGVTLVGVNNTTATFGVEALTSGNDGPYRPQRRPPVHSRLTVLRKYIWRLHQPDWRRDRTKDFRNFQQQLGRIRRKSRQGCVPRRRLAPVLPAHWSVPGQRVLRNRSAAVQYHRCDRLLSPLAGGNLTSNTHT
jgi:hypothetical protein